MVRKNMKRPYGLGPVQIERLKELKGSLGFEAYQELLDTVGKLHTENLLLTDAKHERQKGIILGLRMARSLVDEVIREVDKPDDRDRLRDRSTSRRTDQRKYALFGSSWWDSI